MLVIPANSDNGYKLQRSLRFRASVNAYLSRTPSVAGNRTKWTWSGWVKRGSTSSAQFLIIAYTGSTTKSVVYFTSGGLLAYYDATSGTLNADVESNAVYRDSSAYMHVIAAIDTTQATAANRVRFFVNGSEITSFAAATYPAQNLNTLINSTVNHNIGCDVSAGLLHFDGLMSEVNFVDGQALTPSSFGEFDAVTGVWKPKKYTGTYGTNGFYLPFTDNSTLTTSSNAGLGKDFSGNGNYWTTNNISLTAGATYDSFTDVPTLTSATAANFATLNPLDKGTNCTTSDGNLYLTTSGYNGFVRSTFGVSSGKWYWEFALTDIGTVGGIAKAEASLTHFPGWDAYAWTYSSGYGKTYNNDSSLIGTVFGSVLATVGTVIGIALDLDAGTMVIYRNGASLGTAYSGLSGTFFACLGNGGTTGAGSINFGQRPFSYTPPTGFLTLNTFNLPEPTIKAGNKCFDATTYTGNGGAGGVTQTINNSGSMQPDLVWVKARSTATSNSLFDSTRGANKVLYSNVTNAESDYGTYGVSAFNSNGFSVRDIASSGYGVNENAATYVGWQWKKGATPGFDIQAFTGPASGAFTQAHSLGVTPSMFVVKRRSTTSNWVVWHKSLTGGTSYILLDSSAAQVVDATVFSSSPSSSQINLGSAWSAAPSATYIAYLWAEIPGFSKFGSYTGNGSTDGPFVYCGFRPRYVLIKCTSNAESWYITDSSRDSFNQSNTAVFAESSAAEAVNSARGIDFLSNGFKLRGVSTANNNTGYSYIFCAFAENPFKYALAR